MAPPPFEEPDPEPPQLATQWRAAGVLPYAVLDGTVLCMLGKEYLLAPSTTRLLPSGVREQQPDMEAASTSAATEPQYRCWWSDFGGGREPEDASVVHTAAREWAEETVACMATARASCLGWKTLHRPCWRSCARPMHRVRLPRSGRRLQWWASRTQCMRAPYRS